MSTEAPKRRSFLGRLLRWTLLLLLVAAGLAGWRLYEHYRAFSDTPIAQSGAEPLLMVGRGDSFRDVLHKLRGAGVREGRDLEWQALAFELDVVSRLQVGEYEISHGLTPRALLRRMAEGRVVQHRITIVEGWTVREMRAALAKAEPLRHITRDLSDAQLMEKLGHAGQHPEGRFLPETYHYTRGTTDLDVLRRAYAAMQAALSEAWEARADDTPLKTLDEALTLASIVEKETGVKSERPQIAGVFSRRLKLGMLLQTDPTVIYGMGSTYDGNIRRRDLGVDTPYNTYTRAGLPPTPIALPGRAALAAATQPAPGEALYFVSRGDGSHAFSATLSEHNRAVACHQLKRCRQ